MPCHLEREIKIKKYFYPLGLSQVDCQVDEGINGCVIVKIDKNSAISRDNRLRAGDYLLSVNNEQMRNLSNSSARSILNRASLTSRDVVIIYIPQEDAICFSEQLRQHVDNDLSRLRSNTEIICISTTTSSSSSSSICSSLFSSSSSLASSEKQQQKQHRLSSSCSSIDLSVVKCKCRPCSTCSSSSSSSSFMHVKKPTVSSSCHVLKTSEVKTSSNT